MVAAGTFGPGTGSGLQAGSSFFHSIDALVGIAAVGSQAEADHEQPECCASDTDPDFVRAAVIGYVAHWVHGTREANTARRA